MRALWATDVHWQHAGRDAQLGFIKRARAALRADPTIEEVWITGDISSGKATLEPTLQGLVDMFRGARDGDRDGAGKCPPRVRFVLGNHDGWGWYWWQSQLVAGGLFPDEYVSRAAGAPGTRRGSVNSLGGGVYLVCVDGVGDGVGGGESELTMEDWFRISEFGCGRWMAPWEYREKATRVAKELGHLEGLRLRRTMDEVPNDATRLVVLTHVPPWVLPYFGVEPSDDYKPWFHCAATGEVIEDFVRDRNSRGMPVNVDVFCGHTHSNAQIQVGRWITCRAQRAAYGRPGFAVVDVGGGAM